MQTPTTILTFGEIMGRINPPGHLRFAQAMPGMLELSFAGAEANVAASIAMLGGKARFVTSLPRNVLGDACERTLRGLGVDTSHIVRTDRGRLGLYFVEKGANQRPSQVVYDRDHSSIALSGPETYDWQSALAGAGWLHTTGITAALSRLSFESTLVAVKAAKAAGLAVSCDLNFRKKLWRWEEGTSSTALAGRCMREILPYVDVVIANGIGQVVGVEVKASASLHSGHAAGLHRLASQAGERFLGGVILYDGIQSVPLAPAAGRPIWALPLSSLWHTP
jgi:2-dehydro-3-deoxygluconokinase